MPLSWNEIRANAIAFSKEWANESSEDAEAKTFWDEFFRVFGVPRRRVAVYEKLVAKAAGKAGFIDLFWPKVMIAEHKSKGKNLDRAFTQAIDYFPGLEPAEYPQYVVVSDFARIRLTNLDTDEEFEFPLQDLHKNVHAFGFIAGYQSRNFKEQDPVNIRAAQRLAELHDALAEVGYETHELEVYLVRLLFSLFADDTGIFMPRGAFEDFIGSRTSEDGSDLAAKLAELFFNLNRSPEKRLKNLDEQIAAFPYINGKLFEEVLPPASFDRAMRDKLLACCDLDWGAISPAIFGSLFQGIMDKKMRRNLGAHYTSESNILKVIGPLFMDDLKAEFERVKTQSSKLKAFHEKLASLNFFDPACGCGNFLVISYREIRLLELEVIKKLYAKDMQQLSMDVVDQYVKVNVDQFHGIEIEEWPAQIARVAMWLIDHQMNILVGQVFGQALVRIPLIKSANIVHGNALHLDWNSVLPATNCNYLFGNPPFLGKKEQSKAQKADFEFVMSHIKGSGVLDFVSAWYVKAVQYATPSTECAFVSTNSITQGEQVGILWSWLLGQRVHIRFAHRTFRWSNEAKGVAAVHCVIIGFALRAPTSRVIYDYVDVSGTPHAIHATNISPYLIDGANILLTNRREHIGGAPKVSYGSFALDDGCYTLDEEAVSDILAESPEANKYIRPFIGGNELIKKIERYCLWLKDAAPKDISKLSAIRKRVEKVKEWREKSDREATRKLASTPALFAEIRQPAGPYLAFPTVSSERRHYIPIAMLDQNTIASNQIYVVPNATLYDMGILMSGMHMAWVRSVCGRMKSDYRYSSSIVYNNFPWADLSDVEVKRAEKLRLAIEIATHAVLDARSAFPDLSLSDLYDPLAMPSALVKTHQVLDRAVDAVYAEQGGKKTWNSDAERVAFLFDLYQKQVNLLPAGVPKKRPKTVETMIEA